MQTRIMERIQSALLRGALASMLIWTFAGAAQAQTCNGLPYSLNCCIVNGVGPVDCIGTASHDVISVHPNCFNQDVVIVGLGANDTIKGGSADDTICGHSDVNTSVPSCEVDDLGDHLLGGNGDDIIFGGGVGCTNTSNDRLAGGKGNDTLYGQDHDDKLWGGEDDDDLFGGDGDDQCVGQAGDDYIECGDGDDILIGNEGNDTLCGGNNDDTLNGGKGDDCLDGGPNVDKCIGGFGTDEYTLECEIRMSVEILVPACPLPCP